jgi:hypothetical protein
VKRRVLYIYIYIYIKEGLTIAVWELNWANICWLLHLWQSSLYFCILWQPLILYLPTHNVSNTWRAWSRNFVGPIHI